MSKSALVGLDPSLTSAGIAQIGHPLTHPTPHAPKTLTIGHSKAEGASLAERAARIQLQARLVLQNLPAETEAVVIEAMPMPNPKAPGMHSERSGLFWAIAGTIQRLKIPIVQVSPTTLKKWATGNGRADKTEMLAAMRSLWPHADLRDHNQADALALATIGAMRIGWLEPEHEHHHEPNIKWPANFARRG